MISRDGLRSSSGVPSAGASARGTKSTGTNQARPSRAGGAGNEISRPATEARLWPGRQDDGLGARRNRQAARQIVFADGQIEELRQVVEREHLLAIDEPGGECAAAFGGKTAYGAGAGRRLRPERAKREQQRACS